MILLDSLYICNGGGKTLLIYLVDILEQSEIDVFYLFDSRCKNHFQNIPKERKIYLESSLWKRHQFYKKNKGKFSKVFCFGNLAPTIKLDVPTYTYFHQALFLSIPKNFPIKDRFFLSIKTLVFQYLLGNTDFLLLQTENIKSKFQERINGFPIEKIKVLLFYESLIYPKVEKIKNTFLYVSGGGHHKNHLVLLKSFKLFYDEYKRGTLILTISEEFKILCRKIEKLKAEGYPIINLGFLSKKELAIYYAQAEYVIYPSMSESLGLGIIEGLEAKCKIIGVNLPYMTSICTPSLVFNPNSVDELVKCFKLSVLTEVKESKQKVFNEIKDLLKVLADS